MNPLPTSLLITFLCVSASLREPLYAADTARPNVLFIIVDDLNDMPLDPIGKPDVPTPNFDRLAARGVSFTNAHCNDPLCAPSRSSMMTGLYPQTSSLYWFEDYRQNYILSNSVTLTEHLATNGYGVYTTGKIYHGNQDPKGFYAGKGPGGNIGPWPWDGTPQNRRGFLPHPQQLYFYADDADPDIDYKWEHTFGPLTIIPEYAADPENGIPGYKGWTLSGKPWKYNSDEDRDPMPDELNADWAVDVLAKEHDKPFALFTGFSRAHTPLYAPKKYFDMFPLDEIEVPGAYLEGDLEDCAPSLANTSLYAFRRYQMLFKHEDRPQLFKEWLQAYMACVAFIDDQVGTVLDALDASPYKDNTVVILTSDHGFHVGGKESIYKQTLWDSGTRIPFIVAGLEGMPRGVTCHQPISLIDVYPTFIDLCGLPENPHEGRSDYPLDGHSLKPLLLDPDAKWSGPEVAITALPGKDHSQLRQHIGTLYPHFSVRSKDWRYSLTSDDQEELYHYPTDPNEHTNLAGHSNRAETQAKLKKQLIALRDGAGWRNFGKSLPATNLSAFELMAEVKGTATFELGGTRIAKVETDSWEPVRIRVAGKRSQVWVNYRVASDELFETEFRDGALSASKTSLRKIRIRILQHSKALSR
ncbi:MAG: sulfatase [Verrucomicrobiota bacterium]